MVELTTLPASASAKKIISVIARDGGVILKGAMGDNLGAVQRQVGALMDQTPVGEGEFFGFRTVRAGGILAKCPSTHALALNKTVLAVADHFLAPHCSHYQINLSQAIRILPGERGQIFHRDDEMWPIEKSNEFMLNAMWAVDDFTEGNGATCVVPASHGQEAERNPDPAKVTTAVMPAGSVLIYLGSALHGGGKNRSEGYRTGLVMSYCLGWLRQSENQYLANPPAVARAYPEALRALVGYQVHQPNLGWFEGQDPAAALDPDRPEFQASHDFIAPEIETRIRAYYSEAA